MGFRRRSVEAPHIDLTPMIDVVFLLLIFFMISTTFIENPGLMIDLPDSSAQPLRQDKQEIRIYLTAEGEIYFKRQPISLSVLTEKLADFGPAAKQMIFLLMADKKVLHGKVIQMMDLARAAGFGQLVIATDKSEINPE
ncbi:MAG: biopolymer transporter ExbD [Deltaproteobacteria bacterium]|nr:biopolymer transporter ExbD [Deltaproteobacteria bacterium]